jgi:tetratricopeptide (TPR) repeat protein
MHKLAIPFLIAVGTVGLISPGHAQQVSTQESIRVGTFDSRAVAIVYYQSEGQRQYRRGLRERYEAAEEAGDEWRIMQMDALFPALQHRMHQQGFSTGSIREIMETISGSLAEVARDAEVSAIVSKWEIPFASEAVELVDLTPQIVALIDPGERALGVVEDLEANPPVPMEQLLAQEEGGRSVAEAIRPIIDEQGVEAGVERYRELQAETVQHHRKLREARQEEYDFSEGQLNDLGYRYLTQGQIEVAIELFELNVEAYPDAFNTYDSLGEAYMEAGQTELAVQNYKRSLELNTGNENARDMLKRMEAGGTDEG